MFAPTTKLEVAKFAAHCTVAFVTAEKIKTVVANHTDINTDTITANVGAAVAGHVVATKTDPYTDDMCNRAFNWYADRKAKKAAKKSLKSR